MKYHEKTSNHTPDTSLAFGRGVTNADMRRMEDHFASVGNDEKSLRDRAIFLIASRTALRAKEIISLRWSHMIRTPENTIAFSYRKKGGRTAFTVPGAEALHAVEDYQKSAGLNSDFFFLSLPNRARNGERSPLTVRSLQRLVHSWGEEMQIEVCRPRIHTHTRQPTKSLNVHAFRHTALQRTFDEVGAAEASKLGSHVDTRSVQRYYTRPFFLMRHPCCDGGLRFERRLARNR